MKIPTCFVFVVSLAPLMAQTPGLEFLNHNRPMTDAHNCYPYGSQWTDRVDRALGTGYPVGIEQDLAWGIDPATGKGRPVVSHDQKTTGNEPSLRDYFFEHVRPRVEQALRENNTAQWPLITVHFDVKDNRPELLHAVWDLLGEYEAWITTAPKMADPLVLAPLHAGPLLVLTEDNDAQEQVFFTSVPVGSKLRVFGSAHTAAIPAAAISGTATSGTTREQRAHLMVVTPPEKLLTEKPTNYRRWWNNSWAEVEEGGQENAGDWTADDNARLHALVDHAHRMGFWIRFYTLDGYTGVENRGWDKGYNFGSRERALARWNAVIAAGVNLIATDQYEDFADTLKRSVSK